MSKRLTLLLLALHLNFAIFMVMLLYHPDQAAFLFIVFINNTALIWASYGRKTFIGQAWSRCPTGTSGDDFIHEPKRYYRRPSSMPNQWAVREYVWIPAIPHESKRSRSSLKPKIHNYEYRNRNAIKAGDCLWKHFLEK